MTPEGLSPPEHLSREAAEWWLSVASDFELDSSGVKILGLAAGALDRAEEARAILAVDGIICVDRFDQRKPHPAVAIERDSRLSFARLVRELALPLGDEIPADPRPPRIGGVS